MVSRCRSSFRFLLRLTGEQLEDSLAVAPSKEYTLFRNREKFDLVVLYDADSENYGTAISPMSAVVRIIYETAFQRILKRNPVLLVGGLRAWKNAYPAEVVSESETSMASSPVRAVDDLNHQTERSKFSPSPGSSNPFSGMINGVNGTLNTFSTNGMNGTQIPTNAPLDTSSHEIWMPTRPRSGTDASTTSSTTEVTQDQSWSRSPYAMHQIPEHDRCELR